jgi:prepilin-type N-terminal cleavage/methylation domain-containing protein
MILTPYPFPRISRRQAGFSLIELLVAATVFTFVAAGVSGLFVAALNLQRRAANIQKVEENAQFAMESIAREVRVSVVTSGDTACDPLDPIDTRTLVIEHPVNGTVTYQYDTLGGRGALTRNGQPLTSDDVNVTDFAFCVSGSAADGRQTRVTMPMTLESGTGRSDIRAVTSLQTSVVSRDLTVELTQ